MEFQEQKKLFKVRKTVLEMIRDRGFTIPENKYITFEEFQAQYDAKNCDIYMFDENKNKKI